METQNSHPAYNLQKGTASWHLFTKGGLANCWNSRSFSTDQARDIGMDDTYATFILSSSTLNLRHFSIVMGSKCKGIMGSLVLCTSPVPSWTSVSYLMFVYYVKPQKSMHIVFQLSILYFSWQSYTDLIFLFLLLPWHHRNTVLPVVCLSDTSIYSLSTQVYIHDFVSSPHGTRSECSQTRHLFLAFTLESPIESRAIYLLTSYLLKVSVWEDI